MLSIHPCNLCPRRCGVDRRTQAGFCKVTGEKIRVGRASLHMWEEPPISGKNGSGTIFFSGCTLRCPYCQNYKISHDLAGLEITVSDLANTMLDLERRGAHNINFVTPTHYAAAIIKAVKIAREAGMRLPVVYNTGGYEREETIDMLRQTVDIYLTDLKYFDGALSERHIGVRDYFAVAERALCRMVSLTGAPVLRDGLMKSGVIVRHLVLPGHTDDSKKIIRYLFDRFGNDIIISIMNQYTPLRTVREDEMNYTLDRKSYDEVIDFALSIGVENAFIQQDGTQDESFVPEFNGEGIIW